MTRALAWGLLLAAGCRTGVEAAPDEVAIERFEKANDLFENRRYGEAAPHYRYVISKRDRLKDAYHRLAYCLEVTGAGGEAITLLENALKVDRHDEYAQRHLARLYTHYGYVAEAVKSLKDVFERHPEDGALKAEIARLQALQEIK